jgi:hypothetical protein
LVVEQYFDSLEARVPRVDLAAATGEELGQSGQHPLAAEAEDRMRLVARLRDCQFGAVAIERAVEPGDEIERQEG